MASSRKPLHIDASAGVTAAVASCLARHVVPGQKLAVGFSGGIDSVVLLHVLATTLLAAERLAELSAMYVHHAISPNADNWEEFCREVCVRMGIRFDSLRVEVPRNTSDGLEGAARRVRHAALAKADAAWILLAHHRNDQAETMLFNLLRGCGVAGAAGMQERNGRILRPLLSVGRDEIKHYALQHQLAWIEDESNGDVRFSRNYLRQRIFPQLEQRFPAAGKNLAGAAARFSEAQYQLDELARGDLGKDVDDFPLSVETFIALGESRARNLLRYLLTKNGVQIPSAARLKESVRQLVEAGVDKHPSVTLGEYRLSRRGRRIYLERNLSSEDKR